MRAWTMPAFSTRYSTLPALASRDGLLHVERDRADLGVRHEAARTEHATELTDRAHHVGRRDHASRSPGSLPCTFATRSSPPTKSAPAASASAPSRPWRTRARAPSCRCRAGSTSAPRTIWSACLGLTPRRTARSTVSSNFAKRRLLHQSDAPRRPCSAYCDRRFSAVSACFFPLCFIQPPCGRCSRRGLPPESGGGLELLGPAAEHLQRSRRSTTRARSQRSDARSALDARQRASVDDVDAHRAGGAGDASACAASIEPAFMSWIFSSASFLICACVILPTLSLFGRLRAAARLPSIFEAELLLDQHRRRRRLQ